MYTYSKQIPIVATPDVLVCGGGLAGIGAAVAAARAGARTMLVERMGFPGGFFTALIGQQGLQRGVVGHDLRAVSDSKVSGLIDKSGAAGGVVGQHRGQAVEAERAVERGRERVAAGEQPAERVGKVDEIAAAGLVVEQVFFVVGEVKAALIAAAAAHAEGLGAKLDRSEPRVAVGAHLRGALRDRGALAVVRKARRRAHRRDRQRGQRGGLAHLDDEVVSGVGGRPVKQHEVARQRIAAHAGTQAAHRAEHRVVAAQRGVDAGHQRVDQVPFGRAKRDGLVADDTRCLTRVAHAEAQQAHAVDLFGVVVKLVARLAVVLRLAQQVVDDVAKAFLALQAHAGRAGGQGADLVVVALGDGAHRGAPIGGKTPPQSAGGLQAAPGDLDAEGQAAHIVVERAGRRCVEVIELNRHSAIAAEVGAHVFEVWVADELHPRGARIGEVAAGPPGAGLAQVAQVLAKAAAQVAMGVQRHLGKLARRQLGLALEQQAVVFDEGLLQPGHTIGGGIVASTRPPNAEQGEWHQTDAQTRGHGLASSRSTRRVDCP
ncbi:MAG: FAD-dependent oxidoreductase [Myxococcales bacterium]|nr:FAD-dependent oxidoreductase [Myxococcales bacterium]